MYLVNGEICTTIEVADRGFQYGDGLFETIEIINQQPVFLAMHLHRLETGCLRLCIPFPDKSLLFAEIKQICSYSPKSESAVLKLIISRGLGGRGYRQPSPVQPTRVFSLHPYPDYPDIHHKEGIVARFCQTRLGLSPVLAGIKHLNRLEQIVARAEWSDPNIQEGIMLDIHDHVIEGTMSNLFYVKDNVLYTSSLTMSGIAGIIRQVIINICAHHAIKVVEHLYTKSELLSADEIFLTNSILGIWPLKQIESSRFSVGPFTKQLQAILSDIKAEDLGFEN